MLSIQFFFNDFISLNKATDLFRLGNKMLFFLALFAGPFSTIICACINLNPTTVQKLSSNNVINFLITNADSMLSMCTSLVYVLYYGRIVKLSCKYLSQAVPSTIDIDKCREDIENLVRLYYFYMFRINSIRYSF